MTDIEVKQAILDYLETKLTTERITFEMGTQQSPQTYNLTATNAAIVIGSLGEDFNPTINMLESEPFEIKYEDRQTFIIWVAVQTYKEYNTLVDTISGVIKANLTNYVIDPDCFPLMPIHFGDVIRYEKEAASELWKSHTYTLINRQLNINITRPTGD